MFSYPRSYVGPHTRILQLATEIQNGVANIQTVLTSNGVPSPSFHEDDNISDRLPTDLFSDRDAVIDAATELRDLLTDSMTLIDNYGGHNNSLCQKAIAQHSIATMVPERGQASFGEIAIRTGLPERMVTRLLRHAMTMRIFCEPEPGMVAHTRSSKILVNPITNNWLRFRAEEMWPAATKVMEALEKFPGSQEQNQTGYSLANGTSDRITTLLRSQPHRIARFVDARLAYVERPEYHPCFVGRGFIWASLGKATVVMVGGGPVAYAIALAKAHSNLNIIIQDMEFMMGTKERESPEVRTRQVTLDTHYVLNKQTVEADVYYFYMSLRWWATAYCLDILRAQILKLKKGAMVIIQDIVLQELGNGPLWKERNARSSDLGLAAMYNSQERTEDDWKALLQEADNRFVVRRTTKSTGSALGIIMVEVVWEG